MLLSGGVCDTSGIPLSVCASDGPSPEGVISAVRGARTISMLPSEPMSTMVVPGATIALLIISCTAASACGPIWVMLDCMSGASCTSEAVIKVANWPPRFAIVTSGFCMRGCDITSPELFIVMSWPSLVILAKVF